MKSLPTGAAWRPYLRVLADTALDAASAGGWIAAGGLSPGRRRLARAGLTAAAAATAIPGLIATRSATTSAARPTAGPAAEAAAGHADGPAAAGGDGPAAAGGDGPAAARGDGPAAAGGDGPAREAPVRPGAERGGRPPLVVLRDTPVVVPGARRTTAQAAAAVAVLGGVAAASVGVALAGRRLERRWLARLIRQGHPHPHRALGLRMAAVWAAASLPARLLTARGQAGGRQAAREPLS
jgi:hypothetical protein